VAHHTSIQFSSFAVYTLSVKQLSCQTSMLYQTVRDGRTDAPAKEQSESHSRFDSFVQLVDRWVAETCANSLSPQLSASEHHTIFS